MGVPLLISFVVLALDHVLASTGSSNKIFLGANPKLRSAAIRQELHGVLEEVLGHGHGVGDIQLAKIESTLVPIFRALPKNKRGHLSAPVMRYVVQRYFSQRMGWIVRGFEPNASAINVSDITEDSHILQSKLPDYIRSALEYKLSHSGFTLSNTAVMVAAVERLAFDEVIRGVEIAYRYNLLQTTKSLTFETLLEVLSSYLMIEMLEGKVDSVADHKFEKENIREIYPNWDDAFDFIKDVVQNDGFARMHQRSPFLNGRRSSFEDATRLAQRLSEEYGTQSSFECGLIKDALAEMDLHEIGRVKLSDFYSKSKDGSWQFMESVDYLRQLGALDESSKLHGPQVIISNYVSGMSNCITSAPYYSVCCPNECDKVYQHFEVAIGSPTASPAEILQGLDHMPGAVNLSSKAHDRLQEVAATHKGNVPLHGRLFAQWLHFAFPLDCPYPHVAGTVNAQTPMAYEAVVGADTTIATDEEVEHHIMSEAARVMPAPEAADGMWILHESILESSTPSDNAETWIFIFMRSLAGAGMLISLVMMLKNVVPQVKTLAVSGSKSVQIIYSV